MQARLRAVDAAPLVAELEQFGADAWSILVVDATGSTLEVVRSEGYDGGPFGHLHDIPVGAELPPATCVRTAQPLFYETLGSLTRAYPVVVALPYARYRAFAFLPLVVNGGCIGAVELAFATERSFHASMRDRLQTLAADQARELHRLPAMTDVSLVPAARSPAGSPLTDRESAVLAQLATGQPLQRVARELHVTLNTLKTHVRHVYRKLGVNSRAEAVSLARARGLL